MKINIESLTNKNHFECGFVLVFDNSGIDLVLLFWCISIDFN